TATGFERRYGVLRRLGTTPLTRLHLLTAKTAAVVVVEAMQVVLLVVVGYALGWSPKGSPAEAVALLLVGTATFSGLGLLLAGTLRAVTQHRPDIVMTGHDGDRLDGPAFLDAVRDLDGVDPKLVGVVDEPDASMSARYVDAGATMVVSRPLDRTDVRLVLRHRAGG